MSPEEKSIAWMRLERAEEAMNAARVLIETGSWHGAMNRLYYACFYAVNALLYVNGMASAKHSGVRSLFNKHFVHTGKVRAEAGALYNTLFDRRLELDYDDLVVLDPEQVTAFAQQVPAFIEEVRVLVRASIG